MAQGFLFDSLPHPCYHIQKRRDSHAQGGGCSAMVAGCPLSRGSLIYNVFRGGVGVGCNVKRNAGGGKGGRLPAGGKLGELLI